MSNDNVVPEKLHDQRMLKRKRVLLGGVIADNDGANAIDCTIQDISECGARVRLDGKDILRSGQVYLLDTHSQIAYLAEIQWAAEGSIGLAFVRTYALDKIGGSDHQFLKSLLLDAKLRQVLSLTRRNLSLEEVVRLSGIRAEQIPDRLNDYKLDEPSRFLLTKVRRLFCGDA